MIIALADMSIPKANAYEVAVIDGIRYEIDSNTKIASVQTYGHRPRTYEGTTATVPSTITYNDETYQVELGKRAFAYAANLADITLHDDIETIKYRAFEECTSLSSITLPKRIKKLGDINDYFDAQSNLPDVEIFIDSSLKSIIFQDSTEAIGDYCFLRCTNLEKITFPRNLKKIGAYAFESDMSLNNIVLPENIDSIGKGAFNYCSKLEEIYLPDNIRFIGRFAFQGTNIKKMRLPENLEVVRTQLFRKSPIESLEIGSKVVRFLPAALLETPNLKELKFKDGTELLEFEIAANKQYSRDPHKNGIQETDRIGKWLGETNNIENLYLGRNIAVWIPEGFEYYGYEPDDGNTTNPFFTLDSIKEITIGELVTDASNLVFENYPTLEKLTILSQEPPILSPLTAEQMTSLIVTVPQESIEAYRSLPGRSDIKNLNGISSVDINMDNNEYPVEYFDFTGKKVVSPGKGFYIRRQGSKTEKISIK